MKKYTKGPWEYSGGSVYSSLPKDKDGYPIVRLALMDREEPETLPVERDANAKLMAAAPDLLEACKLAFEELKPQYRAWGSKTTMGMLETAINKAEGRE